MSKLCMGRTSGESMSQVCRYFCSQNNENLLHSRATIVAPPWIHQGSSSQLPLSDKDLTRLLQTLPATRNNLLTREAKSLTPLFSLVSTFLALWLNLAPQLSSHLCEPPPPAALFFDNVEQRGLQKPSDVGIFLKNCPRDGGGAPGY